MIHEKTNPKSQVTGKEKVWITVGEVITERNEWEQHHGRGVQKTCVQVRRRRAWTEKEGVKGLLLLNF